jgi:hypothetical protein
MAQVYWADRAREKYDALPDADQDAIDERLLHVAEWPEFYPEVQDPSQWQGHRKFVVRRQWIVLYRIRPGPTAAEAQVYIVNIVAARSDY